MVPGEEHLIAADILRTEHHGQALVVEKRTTLHRMFRTVWNNVV